MHADADEGVADDDDAPRIHHGNMHREEVGSLEALQLLYLFLRCPEEAVALAEYLRTLLLQMRLLVFLFGKMKVASGETFLPLHRYPRFPDA